MELGEFIEQTLEDYRRRVYAAMKPLTEDEINWMPNPESNSIAFIVWHVARVEDRWTNTFAKGAEEVWLRQGWHQRFGLPEKEMGLRFDVEQLSAFPRLSTELLEGYFDAVREETLELIHGLGSADFDDAPDRSPFPEYPPAVERFAGFTYALMFRQLIGEEDQHLGQVSYIRGLQRGLDK